MTGQSEMNFSALISAAQKQFPTLTLFKFPPAWSPTWKRDLLHESCSSGFFDGVGHESLASAKIAREGVGEDR